MRDILEENATNSRPTSRQNSLKKNGQLRPLLGAGQPVLEPNVTKCVGIQNGNVQSDAILLLEIPSFFLMDHSPIRQTFELGKFISTAGKSILNLVKW